MKKLLLLAVLAFLNVIVNAQTKGYEKSIELGYQMELGQPSSGLLKINNDIDGFSAIFMNGYRFNESFFIGGGLGFEYSAWQEFEFSETRPTDFATYSIPILLRGKFNIIKGKVSPYILLDAGYNLFIIGSVWKFEDNGRSYKRSGMFVNPALGVDFKVSSKQTLFFHCGYNIQFQSVNEYHYNSYSIGSLSFKFGLKF